MGQERRADRSGYGSQVRKHASRRLGLWQSCCACATGGWWGGTGSGVRERVSRHGAAEKTTEQQIHACAVLCYRRLSILLCR